MLHTSLRLRINSSTRRYSCWVNSSVRASGEISLSSCRRHSPVAGGETALAVSGQDTSRWVFEGFLPVNKKQKRERLAELQGEKRTVIFYEAPHKLRTTLDDLANAFGADRSITLCRELTKLHEDIWKTTLGEAVEHYKTNEPRGEYVLVMAGAPETADPEQELTLEQAAQRALELTGQGFGPTAAAKAAAQGTPYSKSEVYKQLLVLQQGQQAGE